MNDTQNRKYKKQVSLNGWQVGIHKWAYGKAPNFRGYCPFFWATFILLIISPFILIGKVFEFSAGIIKDCFNFKSDDSAPVKPKKLVTPADSLIVLIYEALKQNKEENKTIDIVLLIKEKTKRYSEEEEALNWYLQKYDTLELVEPFYLKAKVNIKKQEEKAARSAERRAALQEKRDILVNYTSWMLKPALVAVTLIGGYYLYSFVAFIISCISFSDLLMGVKVVVIGLLLTLASSIAFSFLFKLGQTAKLKLESIQTEEVKEVQEKEYLFTKIINGIGEGISFIIEAINLIYTKECPMIEFTQDKTSKIEKNEDYKG